MLTSSQREYIWKKKRSFAGFLYLFTRYMPFVDVSISLQCACPSLLSSILLPPTSKSLTDNSDYLSPTISPKVRPHPPNPPP